MIFFLWRLYFIFLCSLYLCVFEPHALFLYVLIVISPEQREKAVGQAAEFAREALEQGHEFRVKSMKLH
jgi:hypothetical protein